MLFLHDAPDILTCDAVFVANIANKPVLKLTAPTNLIRHENGHAKRIVINHASASAKLSDSSADRAAD